MGRYIRWQAILAFTGIAMTLAFLSFLALSRTTVTVPDVGGVYTEAIAGKPQFINPLLSQYNQADQDLVSLIFNGLTRIDGEGHVQPDLATGWQSNDDGTVVVFTLRRDVQWQDGAPFTAADVIFTTGLMQDPEFPGVPYLGQLWRDITVEKLDDTTVRFILPEPSPTFLEYTAIGILPRHRLENIAAKELLSQPFNLKPIGTGRFKLDEINARFARLSANPYFNGQKPKLAGLELRFFPSYQATIAAFQAGNVQGISYIPPQAIPQVQAFDNLNLYTSRMSGYDTIYLNLQDPDTAPFFQDAKVRLALLTALDRQAIIDTALYGQGVVANGPILPWSWAYNPQQEPIAFDPERAKQLLTESGWADTDGDGALDKEGVPLAFSLLVSEDPTKIEVAKAVSRQWQPLGISATVEVVGAGLGERLVQHNYQAALAEVMLAGDPDPYPFWHQTQIESGQNFAGWDNTTASQLLETARTITDTGRRNDYYYEFQRIFAEEQPALILFYPVYTYGVSKDIFEVQVAPMTNPSDRFRTIANWYMLTRRVIFKESQYQDSSQEPARP